MWPLCLCPSHIHLLNLSDETPPQKWHLKPRPGTVCRAAGSFWNRISPFVLHAASVTPSCPYLLSGKDPRASGASWSQADQGWVGGSDPFLSHCGSWGWESTWDAHTGSGGGPVGTQTELPHKDVGPAAQPP